MVNPQIPPQAIVNNEARRDAIGNNYAYREGGGDNFAEEGIIFLRRMSFDHLEG